MTATVPPKFHLDSPTTWRPTAPNLELIGWLFAPGEHGCLDIRARVDHRATLGLYGLDRPDIEASLGGGTAARRTGFIQRVEVWRGARELSLDWHDGEQWREFFCTPLDTSALTVEAKKPTLILRAGLVYQTLHHLYRHYHRASWFELCRATDNVLREVLLPTNDVGSGPAFQGFIENPGFWINATYEKFRVTGWMFGVNHEVRQLSATTAVLTENKLVFPKDRPDVAAHRPDHVGALKSGYYGLVDIHNRTPSPANLKIFAELPDGTREIAFARRMYLDRRDEHSGPIPIYRRFYFYKVTAAFLRGVVRHYKFDSWKDARAEIERLQAHLAETLSHGDTPKLPTAVVRRRDQDPYTRWCWHNRLTPRLHIALQQDADALVKAGAPVISLIVPAYNTPERYLRELLECVKRQIYPRWELCIADDASPQPHVRRILTEAARDDARIRPVFRKQNGHIARATNSALEVSTGEFVALLDHDDLLPEDSLLHVAEAIRCRPSAGYLYTDEDKIDDRGRRFDPQLKGDWSPEMAITHNYTHHLTVIRREIVERAGRLRPEFNGAQDIDLFLRCWELIDDRDVVHVPFIGYHWRAHAESTASRGDQKGYLFAAARNSIAETLGRRGLRAEPMLPEFARSYALCLHQLKWDSSLLAENPVTIVIPSRDRVDLLAKCIDSLARTTPREHVKVIVVDDHSREPATLEYFTALPDRTDLQVEIVRAPIGDETFNYSRLVNLGTARAQSPLVLHLNNDVEALSPGWLEEMVGWMSLQGVGIVGAKLLYPDGTLNHAGISLGRDDHLPHVLFEREPAEDLGYLFLPHAARNVAAVTGACLLTRTDLYRQLGGFDDATLPVAYNDVDYCLRAAAAGYRTVFTPQAVLRHVGSASRGNTYTELEHLAYLARHGAFRDPYHGDALQFPPKDLPLNPYHHRYAEKSRPFRALVVTHNLNFEGAPIFIFELARYLAEQPGVSVKVVSPQDGPLRSRFAEAGLAVEIWDASGFLAAKTKEDFETALGQFATTHPCPEIDVIVANTMLTFWAVHFAARLDKPTALYLHESLAVKRFFAPHLPPVLHGTAEEALRLATRVVFTAEATRAIHEELNVNDNFRSLRSWVDFDRIERFKATHERETLRRKHGLDSRAVVVANIGSVCERKGQHIYIRAIDLLKKDESFRLSAAKVEWAMVGARDGLYMETLREDISLMGLEEVKVFPETGDIYDFYLLADILVCTSFEESFPRVLLEAMAFGTRIVSTDVNGIPEMLTNNDEAYLVPAGDQFKLAVALRQAIADHLAGDTKMISMAHARAARHYHHDRTLPLHAQMIREAWLG